jgi:hypothetical protein
MISSFRTGFRRHDGNSAPDRVRGAVYRAFRPDVGIPILFRHPAKVAEIANFSPLHGEKYQVFEVLFNFPDFISLNSL